MEPKVARSPEETEAFAQQIAETLQAGDCLALSGELGAGKTQFVKGLAEGLGFAGEVTSPTFALVQEYRGGRLDLYHFDWYRIESGAELLALGWDDYLEAGGVVVVEWAERFPELLPPHARQLRFTHGVDGSRIVSVT